MNKLETMINNKDSMGLFIGGITHDYNNLLTSIMVNSNLALTSFNENDPIYKNLSSISDAARKASELLHQFSKCYNKKPLSYEAIDFNKTITPIMNKSLIEKYNDNITIDNNLKMSLWKTRANLPSLNLVLKNLMDHVYKENKEGGYINIKSQNVSISEEESPGSSKSYPGDFICLTIEYKKLNENSAAPKKEQNLFEYFYSKNFANYNEETEFFISQRILHQHNGWLNKTKGTNGLNRLEIFLPALTENL